MYEDILVPTDGSRGTERAIEHALDLAGTYGATLHALHVVDTTVPYDDFEDGYVDWSDVIESSREYGESAVAEIEADADAAGVPVVTAVRDGRRIYRAILEYAEGNGVDLIVMGTHGRRGLGRALLGSVTERVVRAADVPVMTVRMTES